jgi:CubicO group peptidase (beta-lactamase class C family)
MTGVPASPDMHFRNGAFAFTYISTMLLELVDEKKAKLDDKLSKFLPDLPDADRVSLENLANMTSGYADYVYEPEVLVGNNLDPFRQWTPEELIQIGTSKPLMFEPGTNWGYSHTNYVILGRVLEKITGRSLAKGMQKYIIGPMGLKQTRGSDTPQFPDPVLHAFSSERRLDLGVPAGSPFYEESTFWNPSWTTAKGAVQTTDIMDITTSMQAVGTGKLLSRKSFKAQTGPNLAGSAMRIRPAPSAIRTRKRITTASASPTSALGSPRRRTSPAPARQAATSRPRNSPSPSSPRTTVRRSTKRVCTRTQATPSSPRSRMPWRRTPCRRQARDQRRGAVNTSRINASS